MTLLTVVIPYVTAHEKVMERALQSVRSQTTAVNVVTIEDAHRTGPAWARNEGVRQAQTPLIAFLDADDILAPDFAQQMISYWRPGKYVYCDYEVHGSITRTKDCIDFRNSLRRHTVTCVMSVQDFWKVGGFDEQIEKAEDVEFWFRCHWHGVPGRRCPHPLVNYTRDHTIRRFEKQDRAWLIVTWLMNVKYGRLRYMGDCGCEEVFMTIRTVNSPQDGYVLVACNWSGNRKVNGRSTGKVYPRCGNGNLLWIDPADYERDKAKFTLQPESLPPQETQEIEPVGSPLDGFSKEELVAYAQTLGIEVDMRYGMNTVREMIDEKLATE